MILTSLFENIDIIIYPLIVGILISLTAAILGVVLVLKRYSMIGDGLSHVSFGVIAVLMSISPLIEVMEYNHIIYLAIPIVMIVAYILLRIGENSSKIKGDAAIGLISSAALAIGYFVGSLSEGFTKDINSMMFGSIVLADKQDFLIILPVCLVVIAFFVVQTVSYGKKKREQLYKKIKEDYGTRIKRDYRPGEYENQDLQYDFCICYCNYSCNRN